ncbi:hypothetical protein [Georgenia sp. SUBG003]|uniref:hypothetical protein n=1 Tax=Georgenia sp. SUBG003 TaxID=1497974 RepID=UPI0004D6869F|nr:hypothetical protein DA06_22935 [Georgenia sp. SUBG003]
MSLHQFGLYPGRSPTVSRPPGPRAGCLSPAAPPVIARHDPGRACTRSRWWAPCSRGAAFFGTASALALVWIELVPLPLGVISEIGPYAVPAGLYVAGNVIGEFFYMVVRFHTGRAALWSGLVETVLAVLGPVLGWILGGLSGAIVGLRRSARWRSAWSGMWIGAAAVPAGR